MKVKVILFSTYREASGVNHLIVHVSKGTDVMGLFNIVLEKYPMLRKFRKTALLAVNQEFVDEDYVLRDGDEVAFMPQMGGG